MSVIASCDDDRFDFNSTSPKLKQALLRKSKKNNEIALSGAYGKNNALTWLRRNIAKNKLYILDVEESLKTMPCRKEETEFVFDEMAAMQRIRESVAEPVRFCVHDSQSAKLDYYSEERVANLKKESILCLSTIIEKYEQQDFLLQLFRAQIPPHAIREILSGVKKETRKECVDDLLYVLNTSIFDKENILKNAEYFVLAIELIMEYDKEKLNEFIGIFRLNNDLVLPIKQYKDNFMNEIFLSYIEVNKDDPGQCLSSMHKSLQILREIKFEYNDKFIEDTKKIISELNKIEDDDFDKVVKFLSMIKEEDREGFYKVFEENNKSFTKERIEEELKKRPVQVEGSGASVERLNQKNQEVIESSV